MDIHHDQRIQDALQNFQLTLDGFAQQMPASLRYNLLHQATQLIEALEAQYREQQQEIDKLRAHIGGYCG